MLDKADRLGESLDSWLFLLIHINHGKGNLIRYVMLRTDRQLELVQGSNQEFIVPDWLVIKQIPGF